MADEVSSIGVRLTLDAQSFMTGMGAATEKTQAFVAATEKAATVAGQVGAGSKGGSGSKSSAARNTTDLSVTLSLSQSQITGLREQLIKGLANIPITISPQASLSQAERVVAAQITPAVGTRSGAQVAVRTSVKRNLPQRAMGGPVSPGMDYIVGERRAEVFRPHQTGSIHPDASRYYREQEAQARRELEAERRHAASMQRIQHARFGTRSVKAHFPNADVDLSSSSRRDRVRIGEELIRLAGEYPHTAQQIQRIQSERDRTLNTRAEFATMADSRSFKPMSVFGLTTGSRMRGDSRIYLNSSFRDENVRGMGSVARNIVEGTQHEFGHAVEIANRILINPMYGDVGRLMKVSPYSNANLQEHFAELFTAHQRGALPDRERMILNSIGKMDKARAANRMSGGPAGETPFQRRVREMREGASRPPTPPPNTAGDFMPEWMRRAGKKELPPKVYRRSGGRASYGRWTQEDYDRDHEYLDARRAASEAKRQSFAGNHEAFFNYINQRDAEQEARDPGSVLGGEGSAYRRWKRAAYDNGVPDYRWEPEYRRYYGEGSTEEMRRNAPSGPTLNYGPGPEATGPARGDSRSMTDKMIAMATQTTQSPHEAAFARNWLRQKGVPGYHGGGYTRANGGAKVEDRLTRGQRSYLANVRAAARRLSDPSNPYGQKSLEMGVQWYPEAQEWIRKAARRYEIPEHVARGVTASLSAGTAWSSNKTKATRIFEAYAQGLPFPYQQTLDAHKKAYRILEGGEDPWDVLGHTPKVGQFYLNTGGDLDAITIDRWALRTATRGAISQAGRGPVRTGTEKAFRRVAKEMGIAPVQLQAALWIQEKAETDLANGRTPQLAKYMREGGYTQGWLDQKGVSRDPELGRVKTCAHCGDQWPLDSQFWQIGKSGLADSWCKACRSDYKKARYQPKRASKGTWMSGDKPVEHRFGERRPGRERSRSVQVSMPEGAFTPNPEFTGEWAMPKSISLTAPGDYGGGFPKFKGTTEEAIAAIEAHNASTTTGPVSPRQVDAAIQARIEAGRAEAERDAAEERPKGREYPWKRSDFDEHGGNRAGPRTHKFEYEGDYAGVQYTVCKHCGYLEGGNHGYEPLIGGKQRGHPMGPIEHRRVADESRMESMRYGRKWRMAGRSGGTEAGPTGVVDPARPRTAYDDWNDARDAEKAREKKFEEGVAAFQAGLTGSTTEGLASAWWEHAEPFERLSQSDRYGDVADKLRTSRMAEGLPAAGSFADMRSRFAETWAQEYEAGARPQFVLNKNGKLVRVYDWNDEAGTVTHASENEELFRPATVPATSVLPATKTLINHIEAEAQAYKDSGWYDTDIKRLIKEARAAAGLEKAPGPRRANKIGTDAKGRLIVIGASGNEADISGLKVSATEMRSRVRESGPMLEDTIREMIEAQGDPRILQAVHDRSSAREGYEPGVGRQQAAQLLPAEIGEYLEASAAQLTQGVPKLRVGADKALAQGEATAERRTGTEWRVKQYAKDHVRYPGWYIATKHLDQHYPDTDFENRGSSGDFFARREGPFLVVPDDITGVRYLHHPGEAQGAFQSREEAEKAAIERFGGRGIGEPVATKAVARAVATEAARVPQHEAPPVLEHMAVIDAAARKRAEAAAAAAAAAEAQFEARHEEAAATEAAASSGYAGGNYPRSAEEIRRDREQQAERMRRLDLAKRAGDMGLYTVTRRRRMSGGYASHGAYIVNEEGPEAFLTNEDARRLAMLRPDILAGIPGARDGARTGMIATPPWGLFTPEQPGLIVPRRHAQDALKALRRVSGGPTDQDRFEPTGPLLARGSYQPPVGPLQIGAAPAERRARTEADVEAAAATRKLAEEFLTLAPTIHKANETIAAAPTRTGHQGRIPLLGGPHDIPQPTIMRPGQYEAGQILTPGEFGEGVSLEARGVGPIIQRPGMVTAAGGLAGGSGEALTAATAVTRPMMPIDLARARAARSAVIAAGLTPNEGVPGEVSAGIPAAAPTAAPAAAPTGPAPTGFAAAVQQEQARRAASRPNRMQAATGGAGAGEGELNPREGRWGRFAAVAAAIRAQEPEISNAEIAQALDIPFSSVPKLEGDDVAVSKHLRGEAQSIVERERSYAPDPQLAEARLRTAGASAYESTRNPKGVAAVLGQLGLGGGAEFKRRQVTYSLEQTAYNRSLASVNRLKDSVVKLEHETSNWTGTTDGLRIKEDELTNVRGVLADRETKHAEHAKKLAEAEAAIEPKASNVIKSFGAIILSTSLYGAAFSATSMLLDKALLPAMGRWADEMVGWTALSTRTTSALGDQFKASHGNLEATMAATAASAGLNKGLMDYVSNAISATVIAKAAGKAQQETSDLFRTSLASQRGQAPEGLYGGYGGILGSGLLGTEMGGGKGFTETIADDITKLGGGTGVNVPFLGKPEEFPRALNLAGQFLTQDTFRNYVTENGKKQGAGGLGAITDALGGVGDFLRGPSENVGKMDEQQKGLYNQLVTAGGPILQGGQFLSDAVAGFFPKDAAPVKPGGGTYAKGDFVPQVIAGGSEIENNALGKYLEDLNSSMDRGSEAAGHATVAHYKLAESQAEVDAATKAALEANDEYGIRMAQQGVVLKDNTGAVIDNGKAYKQATEDAARGKTIIEPAAWAAMNKRALEAAKQTSAIQTQRQIDVELPFETTKQLLGQPIIKPGLGFFPGAGGPGGPSARAAGLTGNAASGAMSALRQSAEANTQLEAIAAEGLAKAREDIAQFTPENLPKFNEAVTEAQGLSSSIASLTTKMSNLNRAASQANWANQIRIATRAFGDAIAMQGKAGGERLGYLQREQYLISRAQQQLSLMLQQRQITTQVALAGFQAPGETGEERYMRQKEKLAEAAIAQRQLNLGKQDYSVAGQLWLEAASRAATDAKKALEVMQLARNAEGYAIAAQETIAKKQQLLANTVGKLDALVGQARGNFAAVLQAASAGVGEFSGSVDTAVKEIYGVLGFTKTKSGEWIRGGRAQSTGYMGQHAAGYLGAFARGATFTVGEAGPETVAILRNPRTHTLMGEGGGGGGMSGPVTININGPVVRDDKDIHELARCVAAEVERSLGRKGQLLGLRSPAY